ncbi:flavin prenyltransferase [Methylacidimicrobium cyclopophantes]|uniref:Flavin prenyltransferase UbiX n=1 Tax=Methylacidimicrobium cyclopophantes TaxID=1041766 RepID=A0A5E6MQC4_9BACT|nr:UbiX family flavin prenyltransferase [Methylacidimicrobium cyclopophantes]VVM07771.1 flavin prenyltransferase [Methylacidimicrobium cyclopophantes]
MRLVVAVTGASGALYAQRLFSFLEHGDHEVHVVISDCARHVAREELEKGSFVIPSRFILHGQRSMEAPFLSGSNPFSAMVIIPCSMGTAGRIAHGVSEGAIGRAADVFLKEGRRLILVPREAPWNLIQARNMVALIEAGAVVIPACPSFYGKPASVLDLVDTVVARVLDHLQIPNDLAVRWKESKS